MSPQVVNGDYRQPLSEHKHFTADNQGAFKVVSRDVNKESVSRPLMTTDWTCKLVSCIKRVSTANVFSWYEKLVISSICFFYPLSRNVYFTFLPKLKYWPWIDGSLLTESKLRYVKVTWGFVELVAFLWANPSDSEVILFRFCCYWPTCINIGRLERTEPNLIHFKWGSRVNRHSLVYKVSRDVGKRGPMHAASTTTLAGEGVMPPRMLGLSRYYQVLHMIFLES